MFVAANFPIIVKNWKQTNYPNTGEWIIKLRYIHRQEGYLVMKRKEPFINRMT